MKIALFNLFPHALNCPFTTAPVSDGWVQASGWVDVEFPPLTDAEKKVADELLALTKRQSAFEADFRAQRKALEDEREALLKTGT